MIGSNHIDVDGISADGNSDARDARRQSGFSFGPYGSDANGVKR